MESRPCVNYAGGYRHLMGKLLGYINMVVYSNAVSIEANIGNSTEFKHHGLGCVVHSRTAIGEKLYYFPECNDRMQI